MLFYVSYSVVGLSLVDELMIEAFTNCTDLVSDWYLTNGIRI